MVNKSAWELETLMFFILKMMVKVNPLKQHSFVA